MTTGRQSQENSRKQHRDRIVIVAGRDTAPLRADRIVRFDGHFFTALDAFQNAAEEPVLFVTDSSDPDASTSIGRARAGTVVSQALVHRSDLGPLGRTVLSRIAAALSQQTDPGTVLAVLAEVEAQTRSFVLVDSPAKLNRPAPSLWQHAWGLLPGTCFLGELGAKVTAIGRRGLPHSLKDSLRMPDSVLYTAGPQQLSATRGTALEQIIEAVRPQQHVVETPDLEESTRWWGPARPLELCVLPRDIAAITHAVRSSGVRCPWCGVIASGAACTVCGSALLGQAPAVGAAHAVPADPSRALQPAHTPAPSITEGQPA